MKLKVIYSLFVGVIFLQSCKKTYSGLEPDFKINSFPKHHVLNNGKYLINDSLLLGNSRWIRYHPDSFLIVQELGSSKMLKIIDLKTGKIQEIIDKGRGPNEMITAWGINIVDKNIWVYGGQLKKMLKLSYDEERQFYISDNLSLDDRTCMTGYAHNDSTIVGLCLPDTNRLTIYDRNKNVNKIGKFPLIYSSNQVEPNNNVFTSFIAGGPNNKVVLACTKTDILEIYDINKGLEKRLHGPKGIKIEAEAVGIGMGTITKTTPPFRAFYNVVANAHEFCVGYTGYETIEGVKRTIEDSFPKRIFCFSWDGEPKREYIFDIPILSFDFDWKNKKIYALTITPEAKIIIYDINEKM
ncbi:BF3164 family lipoprotein [Flavivirga algicola]|uniref:Uncharacterized protein n=1 Tax=Flavivirga algicola TaxID=2729136 RepID=A0ABX1S3Q3_9FLAO|nr:BF3164 family lipoprotein [Flavivirga algicola]NMH89991.1 hypothetical protein [Flavivirga algicola]